MNKPSFAKVASLVLTTLRHCIDDDKVAASNALSECQPYLRRTPLDRVLFDVVSGRTALERHEGVYFLGQPSANQIAEVLAAVQFVLENTRKEAPTLIIATNPDSRAPCFAFCEFPDLAYVQIRLASGSDAVLQKVREITHEVAHCFLYCGHRFIDEGIATYFEERRVAGLPVCRDEPAENSDSMSLRALLLYDATLDPFFTILAPTNQRQIYRKAARFIAWTIDQFGFDHLEQWLSSPFIYEAGEVAVQSFVSTFGIEPERVDAALQLPSPFSSVNPVTRLNLLPGSSDSRDSKPSRSDPHNNAVCDDESRIAVADFLEELLECLGPNIMLSKQKIAELGGKMNRLENEYPNSSNLWLSRAYIEIIRLLELLKETPVAYHRVSAQHGRIKALLDNAISRDPNDTRVICLAASYEFMTPPPHGLGLQGAQDMLRPISDQDAHKQATYALWKKLRPTVVLD